MVVTKELRAAVDRLQCRLGDVTAVASTRTGHWPRLAHQCGLPVLGDPGATAVLVGPSAFVLKHAAAATEDFAVVTPVARIGRPWSRAASWRDDTTLDLWKCGWSPRALERILVPVRHAMVEFVIGDLCRVPPVATQSAVS